ncbi:MAG TPA: DNA polymerase, partial [Blastocatellia bacterium]|nr:DNA polymerase [Blastocatellia bacterium]
ANDIPWPRLPSGELALDDDSFREMAKVYLQVAPIRDLRYALSQMRLSDLEIGTDGRNRTILSTFRSRTGRNQPSNTKFIFGPAVWLRGLIKPEPGFGLAYVDWSQQEFGIAAALSGDPAMMAAYQSGDPYLAFAKQAGAVPPDGTKEKYGPIRDQFKACVLAVQYGMGPESLAGRICQPASRARELLRMHHETYKTFWNWSEAAVNHAMLKGQLWTVFGWTIHVGENANPRSLQNFPMQANGAEMLRLACCLATEQGIRVCAPVHDAILIEAPRDELDATVQRAQQLMSDASAIVLGGFRLRSDAKLVFYPERYQDERGSQMWKTVWDVVEGLPPQIPHGVFNPSPSSIVQSYTAI